MIRKSNLTNLFVIIQYKRIYDYNKKIVILGNKICKPVKICTFLVNL